MTSASSAAAGWYTDPEDPTQQRLFDGVGWSESTRPVPGRFSAKYAHRTSGVILAIIGGLFALTLPGSIGGLFQSSTPSGLGSAVIGFVILLTISGGLIAWAVYLLRGRGENPAAAAARAQERMAAERAFHSAVENLKSRRTGGAAVVAMRYVDATAAAAFGADGPARAAAAFAAIGIDPSAVQSPRIGYLAVLGSPDWFEVYADWVIFGYVSHDIDQHTRMSVYLDGSVQIVPNQVTRGGQTWTENSSVDMREAVVQVVSDGWSVGAPIHPTDVNEARRIAEQLAMRVRKLEPRAASAADLRAMVDAIVNATGQPVAEKLKQLSNLRYDRVLSDEDFELAKSRLLANPGGAF